MTALQLLLVVILLALSAVFVAAEFSLIAARRSVIEPLAVRSRRARSTIRAMEHLSLMMATAQLGITVCGVLLGAVGEPAVAALLEPALHHLGVPHSVVDPIALAAALLLVVGAHVALGEMVPKNIALAGPERVAMMLAPPLAGLTTVLGPLITGLNRLSGSVVRFFGQEPKDELASAFTLDEVAGFVEQSRQEGLLGPGEHRLVSSALDFGSATVDAALLPQDRVIALALNATPGDVEAACTRTGFSRFPIVGNDGRYVGYLHIRDVVGLSAPLRDRPVPAELIRPLPVIGSGSDLRIALDRMRSMGAHLAQVSAVPSLGQPSAGRPADDGPHGDAPPSAGRPADAPPSAGRPADDGPHGDAPPSAGDRLGLITLEDVIGELIGHLRGTPGHRPV